MYISIIDTYQYIYILKPRLTLSATCTSMFYQNRVGTHILYTATGSSSVAHVFAVF